MIDKLNCYINPIGKPLGCEIGFCENCSWQSGPKSKIIKLAIAENYGQFRNLVGAFYKEYKYLARLPDDLRGLQNCELHLIGRYAWRDDYYNNQYEIEVYCAIHNIKIFEGGPNE